MPREFLMNTGKALGAAGAQFWRLSYVVGKITSQFNQMPQSAFLYKLVLLSSHFFSYWWEVSLLSFTGLVSLSCSLLLQGPTVLNLVLS